MSRGPGAVQRKIIAALAQPAGGLARFHMPAHTARWLACAVYGPEPTQAQLSAIRRALARLISEGRVERAGPSASISHAPRYTYRLPAPPQRARRPERPRSRPMLAAPAAVTWSAPCPVCGKEATFMHGEDDSMTVDCAACASSV